MREHIVKLDTNPKSAFRRKFPVEISWATANRTQHHYLTLEEADLLRCQLTDVVQQSFETGL